MKASGRMRKEYQDWGNSGKRLRNAAVPWAEENMYSWLPMARRREFFGPAGGQKIVDRLPILLIGTPGDQVPEMNDRRRIGLAQDELLGSSGGLSSLRLRGSISVSQKQRGLVSLKTRRVFSTPIEGTPGLVGRRGGKPEEAAQGGGLRRGSAGRP